MRGRLNRIVLAAVMAAGVSRSPLALAQEPVAPSEPPAPRLERVIIPPTASPPAATAPPPAVAPPSIVAQPPIPTVVQPPNTWNQGSRPSQRSPLEVPPPPESKTDDLRSPPLEAGDQRFPINLATALRLSDARPLIVAAAQAIAWSAEAQLQKAKLLWVPDLYLGAAYIRHDGYGPDTLGGVNVPFQVNALGQYDPTSFGKPLAQSINMMYAGGSLFYMQYLTDVYYEPLRTRQRLNAKRWDIQTAKNDALLMTARAYFEVHKFRGQYAGAVDVVQKGRELLGIVDRQSKDLVPGVEVDRVRTTLADMEQQAVSARQYWRRASIDLTQVLRLDPRAVVDPLERDHLQITLIDAGRSLDELIPIGLTNRPELAANQALVQATLAAIKREKMRPFLPSVMLNGFQTPYEMLQFGALGIGNGNQLNNWSARVDMSPGVLWQADSLGLGNLAMIKRERGKASRAIVELFQAQDAVAGDVTRAQASVQSAAARIVQAERELQAARINYNGNIEGLKQTRRFGDVLEQIFRPQEAVFALQLLKLAYDEYFETVAEYNQAQFELFHALGYPARELAFSGDILNIDTARPGYLPPVGVGPPPPTR